MSEHILKEQRKNTELINTAFTKETSGNDPSRENRKKTFVKTVRIGEFC